DGDPLVHEVADESFAVDREPAGCEYEAGEVGRRLLQRLELGSHAVDRQDETREEAGVRREESRRRRCAVDVASLVADAERRPVLPRERHGYRSSSTTGSVGLAGSTDAT